MRDFSIPVDAEQSTFLKVIRVDPQQKTISSAASLQKNFGPDGYDSYQRGFFFDDTLATLSLSELEVFLRSDGSKVLPHP